MKLENIILPGRDVWSRWDVDVEAGRITSINPSTSSSSSSSSFSSSTPASLLLPSLCHPHIHLDKAYLLTSNNQHHPTYPHDLTPQTGSFHEALSSTSLAKHRYTPTDLYLRGSQLLATSALQGVTSCRAFVELDHVTGLACLETAVALKHAFRTTLRVQICAFAQDPIFSTAHGEENRRILVAGLDRYRAEIEVLGTTPYVEQTAEASLRNIRWAIDTALERSLHLDFHLDYNLDVGRAVMVWDVLRLLREAGWKKEERRAQTDRRRGRDGKTVVLGHCSRLTLCSEGEMVELAKEIKESGLPVALVGLPTSDLFMMGRPVQLEEAQPQPQIQPPSPITSNAHRPRGTLQIVDMIRHLGLSACLSVNNVGNAFTPWGTGDPLSLASLGVGIYQAGTDDDAKILYECVSSRAREAIGLEMERDTKSQPEDMSETRTNTNTNTQTKTETNTHTHTDLDTDTLILEEGHHGPFLLIRNEEWVGCPGHLGIKVPARQRVSVRDVVWDVPDVALRRVIY
ncbi:hypothetical protein A1O1_04979 [Capronia coronata CBS 617.96]|uniref:Amidohydrolase-related domain-containing protein n=1 Tax=Capronia coronata CBS 617.96 TaxID=1182541 RepID=W9Y5E9_9EURO|nr:uncharacterized protein A1O1_04979 [Capronia coronata CBS 617.96]EXJ88052.1 hypothetical protein A1O1_04979 [Capronia coronata CBS 617.96]